MIQTISLSEGVVLRHCPDCRFKKGAISIQFLRPMCIEEASLNALLPAVLLRGSRTCPDLREITWRLDDCYGATVSTMVRRVGDIQTVGLYSSFMEDRFALPGDRVLAPMADFLRELILEPKLENGCFDREFVESEKRNLISTIESELNDKRSYAAAQMIRRMCAGDSFAVPRLGREADVAAITPETLWDHYRRILRESPVEIFYVGSAPAEEVAPLLMPLARSLAEKPDRLPPATAFVPQAAPGEFFGEMDVNQGKLSMGFTTSVTNRSADFAAMQVFNTVYGAGMTSKLFVNVREKLSLCYYASSGYYGSKGIVTVACGIDEANYDRAKEEILRQLEACVQGEITPAELNAAKQALISSLRSTPDSPGALESYYSTAAISGLDLSLDDYMRAVENVEIADVVRAASTVRLHTSFFLKGVTA